MIAIVDYGRGNLQSVRNAFRKIGEKAVIAKTPEQVGKAGKVVFPGVGNFGEAMKQLREKKLDYAIEWAIEEGKPFLGICIGLQALFEESAESPDSEGLKVLQGTVEKFEGNGLKVPQIGWNQVEKAKESALLEDVPDKSFFYFVHGYYAKPFDKDIVSGETDYGGKYCSAVEKDNVFAVQFHPEKSGTAGLKVLENFAEL